MTILKRALSEHLPQIARDELLTCLEPRAKLAPSMLRELADHLSRAQGQEPDAARPWQLGELADLRVELACGAMARTIVDRALQLDVRSLAELAWLVTELLARSLELCRLVHGEGSLREHPDHGLPIGRAPKHEDGWKLLRPLLWACWQALDGMEGGASRLLIERWCMLPHVTFERFALAAIGASQHVAAEEILDALLADGTPSLWDWRTLTDLEQPLQRLWLELEEDGRHRLLAALDVPPASEQEPPRDGRGARLAMLDRAGGPSLPEWARSHLAAFEVQRARAEESRREVTAGDLLALADDELLRRLRSDWSNACEAAWRAAVQQEPRRALGLLGRLVADAAVPRRAALVVVWRVTEATADKDLAIQALAALADLHIDATEPGADMASAIARFVGAAIETGSGDAQTGAQLLALWDRLIGPVATATERPRGDAAGILPIDDLVRTLLLQLGRAHAAKDAPCREQVRCRLDRLAGDAVVFEAALWELGHWLPFVNDLEPSWTDEHLLPALDWDADPAQASFAWEAFLAGSAALPSKLWPKVRRPFVAAFASDRLDRLSPHARERLVQALVGVLLFGIDRPLCDDDARRALRSSDLPMLRSAAWFTWRVVADEGRRERRDALWRSRLGHLLRELWPKEVDKQGPKIWAWLLRMAIELDDAFAEAIAALEALPLPPTIDNAGILETLKASVHPDRPQGAEAVRRLLRWPIDRMGKYDELAAEIEARLTAR